MPDSDWFDLDAYLSRTGWAGGREPDLATLRGVHRAHALAFPFENLDPLAGEVPSLAPADLMAKMVHGGRGGYCYEQNTLLRLALRALGFEVTGLAGRVVYGTSEGNSRPRTHMMLRVTLPDEPEPYLADVGYGTFGSLLEPVPLAEGEYEGAGRRHRLVRTAPQEGPLDQWTLQAWDGDAGDWSAQYAFTLEFFAEIDFEAFNWYIATSPRSPFVSRAFLHRTTPERSISLMGGTFMELGADGRVSQRALTDESEAREIVVTEFGLPVPEKVHLLG
ncbi:arylamine N-acetyltransferase [Streptomyces sp. J2-1]|uniref:arylamine N-acetyltransferase family protein n=1 Tax=Streptomyces corallincola TaxID=2851888 RepID=UPI001C38F83D|nr:arylamine N-acetyltransferase [Streptomyces corallincola]MBV2357513.1 arylamine N-acetyltransferase [Streptomyces corallincola]